MNRALLCLVLLASTAYAQSPPSPPSPPPPPPPPKSLPAPATSKVDALFEAGTQHYDSGEWDAAITAFRQAYALMPDPSFLFDIGQAYRQKGKCREATAAYKSYLRNAPEGDRAKAEQLVQELAVCVKLEEERERELAHFRKPSTPSRKLRWAGLGTGAAGVLLAGGGVIFTVKARNTEHDLERLCRTICNGADVVALDREGERDERNAKLLYALGGTAVAAGATMFLYAVLHAEHVTVEPAPGGAIIGAAVRFR